MVSPHHLLKATGVVMLRIRCFFIAVDGGVEGKGGNTTSCVTWTFGILSVVPWDESGRGEEEEGGI